MKPSKNIAIILFISVLGGGALSLHRPQVSFARAMPAYSESELHETEGSREGKIRALRDEEIRQLKLALGLRQPSNRRADLYFRLAELYSEAYRSTFLLEGQAHEKRLAKGLQETAILRGNSKPYLRLGIDACEEVIRLGISFDKMDQVFYFLGFNHAELGDSKRATAYFENLVRKYPKSEYAGESYREVAEAAFADRQFKKAKDSYLMAERLARPEVKPRVQHRLAWTYYRLREYPAAVNKMKEAVATANESGEKFLSLREEALRDLALFMTESGQVDDAIGYFKNASNDSEFYPRALEKLGKQYEHNADPDKAVKVYEALLRTRPDSESAARSLVKLVDLDLRNQRYKEALGRIQRFKWPSRGEGETQTAYQNLKAMIRRTATEHHEKYRKEGSKPSLATAEMFYTEYLGLFLAKDDPRHETPEIQMYLAEVKRELGKSDEASALYKKVIASDDKRYAKEAAAFWTASLADTLKSQGAKAGSSGGAQPSASELEFVQAADSMQEKFGDTPESREAQIRAAQVLGGYRETQKDAVVRAKKMIEQRPKSQQALTAARLWLQIVSDGSVAKAGGPSPTYSPDDLRDVVTELRANSNLMAADRELGQGKLAAMLGDEETRFKVKAIAKEENSEEFSRAAQGYESLALETKQRDLSEKAFNNAVRSYLKGKEFAAVEAISSKWFRKFPRSPKAIDVLRGSATTFLILGEFELAAKVFERIGKEGGDQDSLDTSARIYEALGSFKKAQSNWQDYLEVFRSAPNRWNVTLMLARSQEATGDEGAAARTYQLCMTGPIDYQAECGARLGDLYLKTKDISNARSLYSRVSNLMAASAVKPTSDKSPPASAAKGKGSKKASKASAKAKKGAKKAEPVAKASSGEVEKVRSPFVGYARFKLAELSERDARFEPLKLPEEQLKRALTQRLGYLEPLSRAYNSALDAGGPWGIAALDRLATWAYQFAKEIEAIEPPKTVTAPEALQRFNANLRGISDPLRKKALSAWQEAYDKAARYEVLSPAVPRIVENLAEAQTPNGNSGSIIRAQGARGKFRLSGVPSDGGADGQKGAFKKVRDRLDRNPQDSEAWVDYGNLLWGMGRPLLSKIAYERGMAIDSRNLEALNNRAVVMILGSKEDGEEDWFVVGEADQIFQQALKEDSFFLPAKLNRATLLNYYRLFKKALPLWEQIQTKVTATPDVEDGIAVALQGDGNLSGAEKHFDRATDLGGAKKRFVNLFNKAARFGAKASQSKDAAEDCVDVLEDIEEDRIFGFEHSAVQHLMGICQQWKKRK